MAMVQFSIEFKLYDQFNSLYAHTVIFTAFGLVSVCSKLVSVINKVVSGYSKAQKKKKRDYVNTDSRPLRVLPRVGLDSSVKLSSAKAILRSLSFTKPAVSGSRSRPR